MSLSSSLFAVFLSQTPLDWQITDGDAFVVWRRKAHLLGLEKAIQAPRPGG